MSKMAKTIPLWRILMIAVKPKGVIYRLRKICNFPYEADVVSSNPSLPTLHKPSFIDGVFIFMQLI